MEQLIKNQRTYFKSQQTKNVSFRKEHLIKLKAAIEENEDQICDALYADFKKPKFESLLTETQIVLAELKTVINKISSWSKPKRIRGTWVNWPSSNYIYKEPHGTVLIIAPWNYPFQLVFAPLVGAIAAGNTAVIKPSEHTPNTSKIIIKIIESVFSKEYVAVVEGDSTISQKLLAEQWDYIFFTGSTRVGQIVYESAAKHLTPVTLELGGKNPTIVDNTANLKVAADRIAWGKFLNAGQTCVATDYIIAHSSIKNDLINELKKSITKFYGANLEASKDFARTINKGHYTSLKGMLDGVDIVFGGETNDTDNFIAPTLVNEPKADSPLMKGEIFGPILPIFSYENEAEMEAFISSYGKPLATYVFSTNKQFQDKILGTYSFGGGAVNDTVIHLANKHLPFGGVGASGIGAYHGKMSFDIFSHAKAIVKKGNWVDIPLRYPPYSLPLKYVKMLKNFF